MTETEKKDIYIAAALGGLGLVLVYLYLYTGTAPNAATPPASTETIPSSRDIEAPPLPTPYNYNVTPYNPAPPIQYAKSPQLANDNCCGGGQSCGPANGSGAIFSTTIAQFSTLLGTGAG